MSCAAATNAEGKACETVSISELWMVFEQILGEVSHFYDSTTDEQICQEAVQFIGVSAFSLLIVSASNAQDDPCVAGVSVSADADSCNMPL